MTLREAWNEPYYKILIDSNQEGILKEKKGRISIHQKSICKFKRNSKYNETRLTILT